MHDAMLRMIWQQLLCFAAAEAETADYQRQAAHLSDIEPSRDAHVGVQSLLRQCRFALHAQQSGTT